MGSPGHPLAGTEAPVERGAKGGYRERARHADAVIRRGVRRCAARRGSAPPCSDAWRRRKAAAPRGGHGQRGAVHARRAGAAHGGGDGGRAGDGCGRAGGRLGQMCQILSA